MGQNPFNSLEVILTPANSIRGALFRLRGAIDELAEHDISYEYMLRKNSYIRADLINMTTLPSAVVDLYALAGGTNSDPVIENAGNMSEPLYIDLTNITNDPNQKYYRNKFFTKLIGMGCPYLSAFPFTEELSRGYGVFTIFDSRPKSDVASLGETLTALGAEFHNAVKALGLFTGHFKLSSKEQVALEYLAIGRTTEDIAALEGVGRRTIELRLESVRKKLKARNSTEAVYKGISYGIINPE